MRPGPVHMAPALSVLRQDVSSGAAADLDGALTLLASARAGEIGPTLRLYRPKPTMAFGQRDANLPGFAAASAAAAGHGFEPLIRKAGGRAAAYHQGCLIVDHIEPQHDAMVHAKPRFGYFGELFAQALQSLSVDAGIGEIPREYCPGEYTVFGRPAARNAGDGDGVDHTGGWDGRIKLVGTAQRVVAGAWLFSSVIVVEDSAPLRSVLTDCYAALGLDWNPLTAGGAADLVPRLTVDDVTDAVLRVYADRTELNFCS
ncbi:lipoyl protein ligase domain-containing protein [Arthrobacter sp. H14-L1]|uniref:lipoyl protein ligase domain-containing protein n=1 Tax=Arthrobacter sp. H14-L1 TaxID=2996697 RepID=UPI00226EB207|nr:lipoate--protein ligase family protein [Arthrobacter sp. H14-L1]MCY0903818.1 lipoate--protein ligase family protein [Arthrobacter sp. H14-L1]